MDVLQDNKSDVSLLDSMGNDFAVVQAARVSYAKDKGAEWKDSDAKLIRYMADHGHGTPFEHVTLKFHVACPIFVRGQWHRHRIGWSYNEISRRYTADDIQFYFPYGNKWRLQDTKNKQSSNGLLSDIDWVAAWDFTHELIDKAWDMVELYNSMVRAGIGREQARMVLPQNLYTRFYATCNLRSLAHFINLRSDPHAQEEIRVYSNSMLEQARAIAPISIAALCDPKPEPEPELGVWSKFKIGLERFKW